MPGWTDALSMIVRYAPELHRLMPLLERLTSPEAREEQRRRMAVAAEAAQKSVETAESTRQGLMELARRTAAQAADVTARVSSAEEQVKLLQADMRVLADQQAALLRQIKLAILWQRVLAVLVVLGFVVLSLVHRR